MNLSSPVKYTNVREKLSNKVLPCKISKLKFSPVETVSQRSQRSEMKVFIVFFLVAAIILGSILNLVNEVIVIRDISDQKKPFANDNNITVGDSRENVIWFLQITDIHISVFGDKDRMTELRQFCDQTVKIIKPVAVLATGDLTDAKTWDKQGSKQFIQEWLMYRDALSSCRDSLQTQWLDIRGNHDSFNTLASSNPFRHLSVQGPRGNYRSYKNTLERNGVKIAFIGMDATPSPGPRRPFNFMGILDQDDMNNLEHLDEEAREEADHTVWFGHYPTSCVLGPRPGVRDVMKGGTAYLCGHLHSQHGLVPNMYTRHHNGLRELELQDWMKERVYRLMAVDHGVTTFSDLPHLRWPAIHITWPPHPTYTAPHLEPLHLLHNSTHIRFLIFSPTPLIFCRVSFDLSHPQPCSTVDHTLYTSPWTPSSYPNSIHNITISAMDSAGNFNSITQPFSLDGSSPAFPLSGRLLLMSNFPLLAQTLFSSALCLTTLPLSLARLRLQCCCNYNKRTVWRWTRKISLLSSIDWLFYPLVLTPLYLAVGPWLIGEIIEGHVGVMFVWGTFIAGSHLPGSLTYMHGASHLLTTTLPTQLCLAALVDTQYRRFYGLVPPGGLSLGKFVITNVTFLIFMSLQVSMMHSYYLSYGLMAAILGPFKTWTAIMNLYLWIRVSWMGHKSFQFRSLEFNCS